MLLTKNVQFNLIFNALQIIYEKSQVSGRHFRAHHCYEHGIYIIYKIPILIKYFSRKD